ncbi:hypothetical protein [Rhizobium sp. RAF56]|uniref:hypothetical protein n=1 Tax=Rhizobium sp. RAF56 TaxID=3233062 RepID=UPI003F9DBCF7
MQKSGRWFDAKGRYSETDREWGIQECRRQFIAERTERENMNLADLLFWEGGEIMEGLGMKQDANFQWSPADFDWVWERAIEHGVAWLYTDEAKKSYASFATS